MRYFLMLVVICLAVIMVPFTVFGHVPECNGERGKMKWCAGGTCRCVWSVLKSVGGDDSGSHDHFVNIDGQWEKVQMPCTHENSKSGFTNLVKNFLNQSNNGLTPSSPAGTGIRNSNNKNTQNNPSQLWKDYLKRYKNPSVEGPAGTGIRGPAPSNRNGDGLFGRGYLIDS